MKELQAVSPAAIHLQWFAEDNSGAGQGEGAQGAGSLATDLAKAAGSGSTPALQGGAQGGTTPATPEGTPAATPELAGFWNAATKGLREDPRLKTFAPKFKSFDDLAKSAMELEEKLGSRVPIPTDKSPPEEIAEYHKKIGVPSTPEEYQLDRDPNLTHDDNLEKEFRKQMHELHAPQPVAAAIFKQITERASKEIQAFQERQVQARAATEAKLKKDWGNDYGTNVETMVRGMKAYASDELMKDLEETGAGNRASVVNHFFNLGKSVREDTAITSGDASNPAPKRGGFSYTGVKS